MNTVAVVNQFLGVLTIFAQIEIGLLIVILIFRKRKVIKKILNYVITKSTLFAFIVAIAAMVGSLFYSEYAGYEPCKLCWYQRIAMYPLVLIFGYGLKVKDQKSLRYGLLLALPGLITALYHYIMQRGLVPNVVCSVVGYSQSCSKEFVMQFGYITIPLMSLTAFVLISLLCVIGLKNKSK